MVRAAKASKRVDGRSLIDLTVSNPTLCGFDYDVEAVLDGLGDPAAMIYGADARGMRSAREAVAGYYEDHGAAIDPDSLILTTSTSEAYGFLFRLLCDAGDEVLVAQPSYPLFDFLADLEDVRLRSYPLFYDFGWWIDFAELERRIGPRTKAILVVHPNNPTGHWTAAVERQRLCALCARCDLALIVDEVFLDYPLEETVEAVSFAAGKPDVLTFILSGMSKIAGLPQMKVAWIATLGPDRSRLEAQARLEVIADTFLTMNAPAQYALAGWLVDRKHIQTQILSRIRANYRMAVESGVPVLMAEAGWSVVLRVNRSAEDLIGDVGVIVHPGSLYGFGESSRAVVSLLTTERYFVEALDRLAL